MKSHKFSIGRASIGGGRGGRGGKRERGGKKKGKREKKKLFNPRYGYLSEVDGINWGEAATHSSWDTFASRRSIKTCTRGKKRRRIKVGIRTNRLSTNDVTLDAATITRMSVMLTRHLVP